MEQWSKWAEYVWYMILILAGSWELLGILTKVVPTLSDLIIRLVKHWGMFGRFSVVVVCIWLIYHLSIEPFKAFLNK